MGQALGHRFILEQFGVVPRIGWQIDPFGHSAVQAKPPPPPPTHTHTIPRRVRLWGPDTRAMVQPVSGARAAAAASIRGREYRRAWPQCVSRAEGVAAVAEVTRFASLITVIRDEIRVPDYGVTRFAVTGFASLITGGLEER